MTTKKCDTCGRNAKAGWKYCWGCHKTTMLAMVSSGYLMDIKWLKAEERKREAEMLTGSKARGSTKANRRVRTEPPARQVCGEMMPSGKGKK
jgi:hypothetical protein